jgi:predicted PurR-regulated permease PerM
VRYAFLVAFIISLLDLLPALGAIAVLAPWSALSFASGNVRVGAGLLILAGVVTLTRQIAEPKIVGKSLGLHPLVALFAMYAGLKLFGAAGLVLGPCAAIVVRSALKSDIAAKPQ